MQVYADNAATTQLSDAALQAMLPYLKDTYGNASSLYRIGQTAHHGVQAARETVAKVLHAETNEIYFTSGGSEADNWAIKGVAELMAKKGKKHIVTTSFEHHAVLHTVKKLEQYGFEITYLPVYENGIVKVEDVKNAIREDTALVTVMYANNEIGTIQPIAEIGAVCREKGVLFHTDAVQAAGHLAIDVKAQNIDMLSISAHCIADRVFGCRISSRAARKSAADAQVPRRFTPWRVWRRRSKRQMTTSRKIPQKLRRFVTA